MTRAARRNHPGRGTERGSMFVEAVIAAAMVALAMGATFQVVADGAARSRGADARRTALMVAQSELDAVGSDIPLEPGDRSGQAGDMVWRVDVIPYPEAGEANATGALWRVVVRVGARAGGPDLVTLESLRLGRAA